MGSADLAERDIIPALRHGRYMVFEVSISNQFREEMYDRKGYPVEQRPECDEEDMRALKALYQRIWQHVDCGEIEIGDREVKNLVEVRTRWIDKGRESMESNDSYMGAT